MSVDGGRLAARTLAEAGVEVVFALHGGHLDTFLTGCKAEGIRLVDFRHEAAAVNAADGYARVTGRLGVAAVTSGPGLTNGLAGITNAAADGVPVLVITSSPPIGESETRELQGGLDLIAMLQPVTKWAHKAMAAERVGDLVGMGVRRALAAPHGPAVVDLPIDVAFTPVDEARIPKSGAPSIPPLPSPPSASIEAAADLIKAAERPVMIVGEAGLTEDLTPALTRLAEQASVPVFSSTLALSGLPGPHPLNGGGLTFLPMIGEAPDLVILAGARQGMFTGGRNGTLIPPDAKIIQIDTDAAEIGRLYPVDVGLVGSVAQTLDALARSRNWEARSEWCEKAVSMRGAADALYPDVRMEADGLHPYRAAKEILGTFSPDTILVCDGGESSAWIGWAMGATEIWGSLNLGYQGHLGVGQGFSIGAQIAHPEKRVVQIAGDGAIGFHMAEWETMVRHNLPIVTVIFNNACWGMSIHGQKAVYGEKGDVITQLAPTSYEQVAKGFGAHGELVETVEEIAPAVKRALDAGGPAVVNVRTSAEIVHPVTTALLGDLTATDEIIVPYYQNLPK